MNLNPQIKTTSLPILKININEKTLYPGRDTKINVDEIVEE